MKLSQEIPQVTLIRRYSDEGFLIRDQLHASNLLIFPDRTEAWIDGDIGQLQPSDLEPLAESGIELLILGTGQRQVFPPPACLAPLLQRGIGVEVMDTGAACRTYNLLANDGRRLAGALFMI